MFWNWIFPELYEAACYLSSFYFVFTLYNWIYLVRFKFGEKILYETILFGKLFEYLIWFDLNLIFEQFAWTHVTLLIVVTQSYLIIQNMFEGLIWFIVPVSMIVCNDVMAYLFGFFFGKTPLIKLSPKKTWEGFIGGGIATVILGMIVCYLIKYYFV